VGLSKRITILQRPRHRWEDNVMLEWIIGIRIIEDWFRYAPVVGC
jgi:hypothetical protein